MRKLLNTLYVTSPDSYLARDGENVVIRIANEERFRVPVHNIEGIVCFGYMGASPQLMALCSERNVALSFLSEHGYFLGRVSGTVSGNVLLRRRQYRMADDKNTSLQLAKICISGKLSNCKTVLQRAIRDHAGTINKTAFEEAIQTLNNKTRQAFNAGSLDILRGIEGESALVYFGVFDQLILANKEDFFMKGRSRRPPLDNVNALLSFAYTLLTHEVRAALESVGLDPYVGFLHTDRPGRPSLALADRFVLSIINRKQLDGKGFKTLETGGVLMDEETRKEVLTAWQKRKQEELQHPYLNTSIPVGLLPYAQALLLARYIRGDIDNYPVFINK